MVLIRNDQARKTVSRKRFLGEHERMVNGLACRSMLNSNMRLLLCSVTMDRTFCPLLHRLLHHDAILFNLPVNCNPRYLQLPGGKGHIAGAFQQRLFD